MAYSTFKRKPIVTNPTYTRDLPAPLSYLMETSLRTPDGDITVVLVTEHY